MAGETPLRPFPVWILFATLMLTGPVIAGCVFPAASDAFGEALEPEPGAIRGLTPQHLRGHPADLAISPDGRHAFIPMPGTISRPDQRIVVVDLLRGSLVESIDVGRRPLGLTADPSAPERVFVTHAYSPSISVLDTSGRRVHQVLTAPYYLEHLAFTSDGGRLLAVDSAEDRLVVYRVEREESRYDLAEEFSVPTGRAPGAIATVEPPDNGAWGRDRLLAVADRQGGSVTLVDLETRATRQLPVEGVPYALASRDGLLFVAGTGGGARAFADPEMPENASAALDSDLLVFDLRLGPDLLEEGVAIQQQRYRSDTARPDSAPSEFRILGGAMPRAIAWGDSDTLWVSYFATDQVQRLRFDAPVAGKPLDAPVLTTMSSVHGQRLSRVAAGEPLRPGLLTDTIHGMYETPPGPRALAQEQGYLFVIAELSEELQVIDLEDCPGPTAPGSPCASLQIPLVDDPVPYPTGIFERGERLFISALPSADQDRSLAMAHPEGLATGIGYLSPRRDPAVVHPPRLDQMADRAPWLNGSVQRPGDFLNAATGELLRPDSADPHNLANALPGSDGSEKRDSGSNDTDPRYPGATARLRLVDPGVEDPVEWMRLVFGYLLGERRAFPVPPSPPSQTEEL